jgi:hypothetical protein
LLRSEVRDPLAAAACAYALLQLGEPKQLDGWTADLTGSFEWLPDGLVVSAEQLARLGRHDEALSELRRLSTRGIPCLSIGLGMATDRLRSYSRRRPEDEELRRTVEELTRYTVATDFSNPVTTFVGQAPDDPGAPTTPPSALGRLFRSLVPDVLERPDGSPVFRFRLPKALRRTTRATATQRSSTMATPTGETQAATTPASNTTEGDEDSRLTMVRISFAVVLLIVFLAATYILYQAADTQNTQEWERLVYIFGAIEAVAFTAIGWVFGREVNRQRAETAEKRADGAEQQRDVEKEKGMKLAGLVVGEGSATGTSSLQPQGPGGGGGGGSTAVDYARRAYGL